MKVAIIGSRNFNDYLELIKAIDAAGFNITEVISGGAEGADTLAEKWADEKKIKKTVFIPDWDNISVEGAVVKERYLKGKKIKYNAAAGFDRNQKIVDSADAVIAIQLENTPGTQDSIKRAKKKGIPVYIHRKYEYEF